MKRIFVVAVWLTMIAGAGTTAPPAQTGSWVLSCSGVSPGTEGCLLRLEKRLFDAAGLTGNLEVLAVGKSLVPVITLRGLSSDMVMAASLAGKAEASLQFDGGPRVALDCGPAGEAYICAPGDAAARDLGAALPGARSVTVRVSVVEAGVKPLQMREKTLGLSGTSEALARLRSMGPAAVPRPLPMLPSQSSGALIAMADKALKAAGYPNGVAGLAGLLARYGAKPGGGK